MRYDPAIRVAKYKALMESLRGRGFDISVQTETDQVDCVVIRHQLFAKSFVKLFCRERGWYIGINGTQTQWLAMYKVSSPSLVRPLLDLLLAETKPITPEQFSFVIKQFSLENVPNKFWLEEEMQEHVERWHQFGWRELADTELRQIQASYDKRFFPNGSLALPIPSVSWRLDFLSQLTREEQEKAEIAITMHALASFRQCMLARDELLVLDWQHTCYRLNVHRGIHKAYRDEWAKPILSAHDDLAYLAPDFHFGLMSMRDGSFHVFGDVFHKVFLRGLPEVAFCNTAFLRDGAN